MSSKFLLVLPLLVLATACSQDFAADEMLPEKEVVMDESRSASSDEPTSGEENETTEEESIVIDRSLDKAYDAFLAQGVPRVPLTRALNYFRDNRASTGGLKDSSCLIKPMSETGAIGKNTNRFDPTTISMLKQGIRNERYIMIVDFTQSNLQSRGYLLDMKPSSSGKYTLKTMTIAHGYGSNHSSGIPQVFTNVANHGTTVSGFFVTAMVTYPFYGTASGKSYTSTGVRLYGLESTNNTAERTSKVAHGAPYVTNTRAGTSAGCPAMTMANASSLLKNLTGGILWYHHTKINNSLSYTAPKCP